MAIGQSFASYSIWLAMMLFFTIPYWASVGYDKLSEWRKRRR
jgi:hypothetical protein